MKWNGTNKMNKNIQTEVAVSSSFFPLSDFIHLNNILEKIMEKARKTTDHHQGPSDSVANSHVTMRIIVP